jgi:hypothetical protein
MSELVHEYDETEYDDGSEPTQHLKTSLT